MDTTVFKCLTLWQIHAAVGTGNHAFASLRFVLLSFFCGRFAADPLHQEIQHEGRKKKKKQFAQLGELQPMTLRTARKL